MPTPPPTQTRAAAADVFEDVLARAAAAFDRDPRILFRGNPYVGPGTTYLSYGAAWFVGGSNHGFRFDAHPQFVALAVWSHSQGRHLVFDTPALTPDGAWTLITATWEGTL